MATAWRADRKRHFFQRPPPGTRRTAAPVRGGRLARGHQARDRPPGVIGVDLPKDSLPQVQGRDLPAPGSRRVLRRVGEALVRRFHESEVDLARGTGWAGSRRCRTGPGRVTRNRGQFPSRQAALKVLYLAVRNLQEFSPTTGIRSSGWKQALQAFTIYFDGRIPTPMKTATITYTDGRLDAPSSATRPAAGESCGDEFYAGLRGLRELP
jgi:hypothetical protein